MRNTKNKFAYNNKGYYTPKYINKTVFKPLTKSSLTAKAMKDEDTEYVVFKIPKQHFDTEIVYENHTLSLSLGGSQEKTTNEKIINSVKERYTEDLKKIAELFGDLKFHVYGYLSMKNFYVYDFYINEHYLDWNDIEKYIISNSKFKNPQILTKGVLKNCRVSKEDKGFIFLRKIIQGMGQDNIIYKA